MHASPRLPILLTLLLLLGAGLLMSLLGTVLPLLAATTAIILAGLVGQRSGGGHASSWVSSAGAIAIFFSGTPIAGSPSEGLLITAVMAIYFVCWAQQIKLTSLSAFAPTGPFTLAFYASLLLGYLLLSSRLFPIPYIVSIFLAVVFILTSLALWEMERRSRLTQAAQVQSPSLPDWLGRFCVLLAVILFTFLLFRMPLPWLAHATLDVAETLQFTADPPSPSGDRQRSDRHGPRDGKGSVPRNAEGTGAQPDGIPGKGGEGNPAGESADLPGRRGQLPQEADLELDNTVRFHLEIPEEAHAQRVLGRPLYLRSHTLDHWKDGVWMRAAYEGKWINDADDGKRDAWVTMSSASADRVIRHRVYLYDHLSGASLVSIPNVIAVRGPEVFRQSDDFFSFRQGGNVSYELVSAPVYYDEAMGLKTLEPGEAPAHCLEKAQGLTFRDMENLLLAPIQTPDRTLKQKLAYIRQLFEEKYTYSYKVDNPEKRDPLANFLFHEKKGYCDFYAQAGAHLLRQIGVPSRVAYGYAGGLYDPSARLYTFRERDAHAWTEMFLKDLGWISFDLVPSGQGAHRPAETQRHAASASGRDPLRQFRKHEETPEPEASQRSPEPPSFGRDWDAWLEGHWILTHLNWILGATMLALLGAYLARRWRQRKTRPDSVGERGGTRRHREPPGYFRDFCELFASLGHQRAAGQTLKEYFGTLQSAELFRDEFDPLLDYHYRVEYEDESRSRSTEKRFSKEIREFRNRR